MIGVFVGVLILALIAIVWIFLNTSPQFGGIHLEDRIRIYEESGLYIDGKFQNQIETTVSNLSFSENIGLLKEFFQDDGSRNPKIFPATKKLNTAFFDEKDSTKITWMGHSTFIMKMNGKTILIDPIFSSVPAPHPWLGTKRFSKELPIELRDIPEIDVVVISHDHYDHLDYESIKDLKSKTKLFLVPLAVGAHLKAWGVPLHKIKEHSWWDATKVDDIEFICTPARHFSGRSINDRYQTLWASWVIRNKNENIYFSGDSGYGPHFKEIGSKFGPFDLSLVECGQYDERWSEIHLLPDSLDRTINDLNTKRFMPIHWGAFVLSLHAWNEPPEKALNSAQNLNKTMLLPQIGEVFTAQSDSTDNPFWWK